MSFSVGCSDERWKGTKGRKGSSPGGIVGAEVKVGE